MDPEDLRDLARCIGSILDVKGLLRHEELDACSMTPQLLADDWNNLCAKLSCLEVELFNTAVETFHMSRCFGIHQGCHSR